MAERCKCRILKPSPGHKLCESGEKRDEAKVSSVKKFLDNVPKMESHYCRSSSSKLYISKCF